MIRDLENMNSESRLKKMVFFCVLKTEGEFINAPEICKRICKGRGNNFFPCLWNRIINNTFDLQQAIFMCDIVEVFVRKGRLSTTNRSPRRTLES